MSSSCMIIYCTRSDGDDSTHPYQSVWMSHWKRTSCKSSDQACESNSEIKKRGRDSGSCLLVDDPELGINVTEYAWGSQQVAESRAADVKKGSPTTISSSKKTKNECLDYRPLQDSHLFMKKKKTGSSSMSIAVVDEKGAGISPPLLPLVSDKGSSQMEFTSASKALTRYQGKRGRSIDFIDNSLTVSTFFSEECKGSASKYLPFHFLSKGLSLHSSAKDQKDQPIVISSSEEHLTEAYHNNSSAVFLRDKTKKLLDPLENSFSTQKNKAFLLHDSSMSKHKIPDLQYDDLPKHSNYGLFNSKNKTHLKASRLDKLQDECYSQPSVPFSIHDVETMRISTAIDSLEESSRGCPKISKTTHHFLITKKTDVNLSEEAQMFRETKITAKLKAKHLSDLFDQSTNFRLHKQKKTDLLQSLGSSSRIVKDVGTSKVCPTNELSADTDTMYLDLFQENHFTGLASHPLNKLLELDREAQSHNASDPAGEFGYGHMNTDLPDINKEVPNFSVEENGTNVKETSTSITQSLDMLKNSKSTPSLDDSLDQNLNSKWVRRLKCNSSSDSANGNRNSQNERATSSKNAVQINNTFKCSHSEPTIGENYAQRQKSRDGRKNRETLLSHPWIQRWCSNRAATCDKKLERTVVCEPECKRTELDEYQGKQFSSIAAMALMGRAMNGFRPCELRKKDSYLVWNIKDV